MTWKCLLQSLSDNKDDITHLLMTPTTSMPQWMSSNFVTAGVWAFAGFFGTQPFLRRRDRVWPLVDLAAMAFASALASLAFATLALAIRASAIGWVDVGAFLRWTGNLIIWHKRRQHKNFGTRPFPRQRDRIWPLLELTVAAFASAVASLGFAALALGICASATGRVDFGAFLLWTWNLTI